MKPENINGTLRQVDYPGAKQHASYYLLKVDLEHALKCVEMIIADDFDESIMTAIFSGAVIAYSRCFVSGRGSKLDASEIFKGNPRNPLVFHNCVIRLRHQVYAHRDELIDGSYFGPIISDTRPAKIMGFGNFTAQFAPFQEHDMKQFRSLIRIVLDHISNKIFVLNKRLKEFFDNLTDDELASLPVATFTAQSLSEGL